MIDLKKSKTIRGFDLIEFNDLQDTKCSIQKSSLATEDSLWIGINEAEPKIMTSEIIDGGKGWAKYPIPENVLIKTRMHLSIDQVKELIPILQKFVDSGNI